MVSVQSVKYNLYPVNFRSDNKQSRPSDPPMLLRQQQRQEQVDKYEKEKKKQKLKNNIITGVSLASALAIIAMAIMTIRGRGAGDGLRSKAEEEALKLKPKDLSKIAERPDGSYSPEVLKFKDKFIARLERSDIEKKGGKRVTYAQLVGPGGTGKTDAVYVLAKEVEKRFPGSELYIPDLSMLTSSSYKGQDVQMLSEYTYTIAKRAKELEAETAKTGKWKGIMVFLDEFDKIAMQDNSHNKHQTNEKIGALKTLINTLKEYDNVMIITATNYPELIEDAVSSRTAQKVLVDYLNPTQIITSVTEHYKNAEMIAEEMKDVNNPKLKQICEILGKKEHKMEFRKLNDDILDNTLMESPETGNIDINSFVKAITNISTARNLNLTPEEIAQLKGFMV